MKTKLLKLIVLILSAFLIFASSDVMSQDDDDKAEFEIRIVSAGDEEIIIDTVISLQDLDKSGEWFKSVLGSELKLLTNPEDSTKYIRISGTGIGSYGAISTGRSKDYYILKTDTVSDSGVHVSLTSITKSDGEYKMIIKEGDSSMKSYAYSVGYDGGEYSFVVIGDGDSLSEKCNEAITIMTKKFGDSDGEDERVYRVISAGKTKVDIEDCEKAYVYIDGSKDNDDGYYSLVLKSKDGDLFITTKIKQVEVDEDDKELLKKAGIDFSNKELEVDHLIFYPNPSDGVFTLKFELEEKGDVNITIVDMKGKTVYNEKLDNFKGEYKNQIDIKKQSPGTYFIIIEQNGKMTTQKVLIS